MIKRTLRYLAIALFLVSLAFPAFTTANGEEHQTPYGLLVFCTGPLGLIDPIGGCSWLANPLALAAAFLLSNIRTGKRNFQYAVFFSVLATLLAAEFLLVPDIMANEAGLHNPIIARGTGYWLWLTANLIMLAAAIAGYYQDRKRRNAPQ